MCFPEVLCRSIAECRRYPEQDTFINGFRARMSGLVDLMKDYWVYEREYGGKKLSRQDGAGS